MGLAGRRPALAAVRLNANRFRQENSETATACAGPSSGISCSCALLEVGRTKNRRIRPPAGTEQPGALGWVSLTSPKGVEPRSARLVRVSERLARHGLSPR